MKKILLLLFIITACTKRDIYYPSYNFFEQYSPTEIELKKLTFKQLKDSILNQLERNIHSFITIQEGSNIYKISPHVYVRGFVREMNGLEISNDSILISSERYPLTQLEKWLKRHYENNGDSEFLAFSSKRAFVKLILEDDASAELVKKSILRIVKGFEKTQIIGKDDISLRIRLESPIELQETIPPPPIN
ncbi:MAG: hypothetical protein CMB99_02270 [Flavobacteriaceae bacterium]|nr:hypothetical protein [Flavobacteriaceae bacterium]